MKNSMVMLVFYVQLQPQRIKCGDGSKNVWQEKNFLMFFLDSLYHNILINGKSKSLKIQINFFHSLGIKWPIITESKKNVVILISCEMCQKWMCSAKKAK